MKIAVVGIGYRCNAKYLSNWLHFFQKSNSDIDPVLIYDENTDIEIVNQWPLEKRKISNTFKSSRCKPILFSYDIKEFFYADFVKISAFDIIGDCVVIDYDTIINRPIRSENIPSCSLGACIHSKYSNFFNDKKRMSTLVYFDEYDYVPQINLGFLIMRQSITDEFISLSSKYMEKTHKDPAMECYGQSIASLVFRKLNGVYLDSNWNWYPDSSVSNNSVMINHFWGKSAKSQLNQIISKLS